MKYQNPNFTYPLCAFFLLAASALFSFRVPVAHAAEFYFGTVSRNVAVGQPFEAGVFLDTKDDTINVAEGTILFPSDLLELKDIRDGGSIVNLWLAKPAASRAPGRISFTGVLPGGYASHRGILFSAIFVPKKEGIAVIRSQDERILRNDGQGTDVAIERAPFTITSVATTTGPAGYLPSYDPDPPEPFIPTITRVTSAFGGKSALLFFTQDKGSGIDRYEVSEARLFFWNLNPDPKRLSWTRTESPYILTDQSLESAVFVKAVDRTGNERIEIIPPTSKFLRVEEAALSAFLALLAIAAFCVVRFLSRSARSSS